MRYLFFLLLAGCASEPIVDFVSPASISVRYIPSLVSAQEAGDRAVKHCNSFNKDAELVSRDFDAGWDMLNFKCVGRK